MKQLKILIVDYGSQYTNVIARTVAELGYYCEIVHWKKASEKLAAVSPKLVILSGSDKSVYGEGAPTLPDGFDVTGTSYHVFGVCYGMQLLVHTQGGTVERAAGMSEYGPTQITTSGSLEIFKDVPQTSRVWMSHGDSVTKIPDGYEIYAKSAAIAAIGNADHTVTAVQFHPEVSHTEYGVQMLQNILEQAGCMKDWDLSDNISRIQTEVKTAMEELQKSGTEKPKALLGLSGGVDSAVAAAVISPLFGKDLHCIIIDHGGLRKDDRKIAVETAEMLGVSYEVIDAADDFLSMLATVDVTSGMEHSEALRKKFSREVYQKIFNDKAKEHSAHFIIQGTNAADLTESGALGGAAVIKSHHNIGLDFDVVELMPLATLYKYQIRVVGRELGLPEDVWNREPFPGPGLYLRLVDMPITRADLDIVRDADAIVRTILKKHGLLEHISQLVVAMFGTRAVGLKGDERVYNRIIAVRPVASSDFMTVSPYHLSREIEEEIQTEVTKHPSISRVLWDYMPKPPATTEYQ